jgi:hypothetical protein
MNGSRVRDPRPQRRPPPAGRTTAMHRQRQNGAGNAHQNYERYVALAREAMSNGDRIEAENFYQRTGVGGRLTVRTPHLAVPTRFQDGLPRQQREREVAHRPEVGVEHERGMRGHRHGRPPLVVAW